MKNKLSCQKKLVMLVIFLDLDESFLRELDLQGLKKNSRTKIAEFKT